ncbi:hypothetical protein R3P38DRAFT_3503191 [Favolaschia claudopus]|uniref:C2H2-type domain-containing protein n=1 Tax=Favolaschia claudopus TaxID=2862362 RepID=A0AAW0C3Z6_9AGAR
MDETELTAYQKNSTELVAYSRTAERAVELAYPIYKGRKIVATGFCAYLRVRGVFIECWCAFQAPAGDPRSCQIVVSSVTGDVFGFCHFDRARCAFKLNITKFHKTSLLTSSYGTYPTIASGDVPDLEILHVVFTLRGFPSNEIAPHFEGYLGEHVSNYPAGTQQLSGSLLLRFPMKKKVNASRRMTSPYARFQKQLPASNGRYIEIDKVYPQAQSAPARMIAGPSRFPLDSGSISASRAAHVPLTAAGKQAKHLQNLITGRGVEADILEDLFERCTNCKLMFTSSALKIHVKGCLGNIEIL